MCTSIPSMLSGESTICLAQQHALGEHIHSEIVAVFLFSVCLPYMDFDFHITPPTVPQAVAVYNAGRHTDALGIGRASLDTNSITTIHCSVSSADCVYSRFSIVCVL